MDETERSHSDQSEIELDIFDIEAQQEADPEDPESYADEYEYRSFDSSRHALFAAFAKKKESGTCISRLEDIYITGNV
jgi:hypothetical protein